MVGVGSTAVSEGITANGTVGGCSVCTAWVGTLHATVNIKISKINACFFYHAKSLSLYHSNFIIIIEGKGFFLLIDKP
jgi:xanthine dehydrogenase iron-sulfur cluster and FAD-binding subunit A